MQPIIKVRDVAQSGSVSAWGAGGRWFESSRPDKIRKGGFASFSYFDFKVALLIKTIPNNIIIEANKRPSLAKGKLK